MPQKTLNSKRHVDPLQNYHYLNSKGRLLHQIIRYDGFQCNTPLKRCCDILLRCFNIIIRILKSRLKIVSSNITLLDLPLALNVFLPTILVKTFGTLCVLAEEMQFKLTPSPPEHCWVFQVKHLLHILYTLRTSTLFRGGWGKILLRPCL